MKMPGFDGTGPKGMGSFTGGGRGYCVGWVGPGATNPGFGGPRAWGARGGGRGWRNRSWAAGVPGWAFGPRPAGPAGPASFEGAQWPSEKQFCQEQVSLMEKQLDGLKKRLAELEGEE